VSGRRGHLPSPATHPRWARSRRALLIRASSSAPPHPRLLIRASSPGHGDSDLPGRSPQSPISSAPAGASAPAGGGHGGARARRAPSPGSPPGRHRPPLRARHGTTRLGPHRPAPGTDLNSDSSQGGARLGTRSSRKLGPGPALSPTRLGTRASSPPGRGSPSLGGAGAPSGSTARAVTSHRHRAGCGRRWPSPHPVPRTDTARATDRRNAAASQPVDAAGEPGATGGRHSGVPNRNTDQRPRSGAGPQIRR
jgi:hypothetical protein